jgi:hypothetical protein
MKHVCYKNGITPRYIVVKGTLITPTSPKRFNPNGGEMKPISEILHISTPYHTGSNFKAVITGKKMGMVK